ncbi:adenosine deaminase [Bradyrhizobium sp. CB3481]|uniref:adenosine deaminase n=1 Tax=Bradyrhizobium sp. CB3481 TaxID=3039158 RepID=UPI0024B0E931|nr:adenosine deaminase [Bradyrhizobium sp. CB3481]WFU18096.1 adenosine deaminase [Bradyrhizobium sp. CB3481]
MTEMSAFIRGMPKTELHMHIEGSLEPELMFALARRNGVKLRWETPEALRAAYRFSDLQSFLDLYFEGCRVLMHEVDFYDVTAAYLRKAHEHGIVRAELFMGPQSFTSRGVSIDCVMNGVLRAMDDAKRERGISSGLMVSAHRHRTEGDALELLDQVMPWSDRILAIGMGGAEIGNPPSKFKSFFRECRGRGFRTTIHAGEASYVREAVELLEVDRIDHGNSCLADHGLARELAHRRIALTVCPLSNLRLNVVRSLRDHPLRAMMDAGLLATVNSDDPPYFDGYVSENLIECQRALQLSQEDIVRVVRNGFEAAFITEEERHRFLTAVDTYVGHA